MNKPAIRRIRDDEMQTKRVCAITFCIQLYNFLCTRLEGMLADWDIYCPIGKAGYPYLYEAMSSKQTLNTR